MYIQFVEFVAEGRKLDFDEAKSVSGMRLGRKDAGTKTLIEARNARGAVKTAAEKGKD
jgi:hypothetical protein